MDKLKIVIAQFYTKNVIYGEYSERINQRYCDEKGYGYYCEKDTDKIVGSLEERSITWYKPKLIQEVLDQHNPDYVLFLDADAVVVDYNQSIEDFIDENYDLVVSDDIGAHSVANAGVLLLKNSEWTKKFLKTWWDSGDTFTGGQATRLEILEQNINKVGYFRQALWHDQSCLTILYENDEEIRNKTKIISRNNFNSMDYAREKFIYHGFAFGHLLYRKIDVIYKERFKEEANLPEIKLIVYHIFCVDDYAKIVEQQLKRLKDSGLYDWCDKLEVTCINTEDNFEVVEELLKDFPKANLNKFKNNDFEYQALKKVWEYSQSHTGKVFYFHTKGVSNKYKNLETKEVSPWKVRGVSWWKEIMEYYLIDNYEDCVKKLDEYDQCGVTSVNRWWWGNFWWSTLDWIRINDEPTTGTRWQFEAWLNQYRLPYQHEYYHFDFNPYYSIIPNDIYKNKEAYKDKKIELISAYYGTMEEQQDEGRPSTERVVVDVTDIIKANLEHHNNKGFNIMVSNALAGDPYYGVVKVIDVDFKIDGEPYKIVASEGYALNFFL